MMGIGALPAVCFALLKIASISATATTASYIGAGFYAALGLATVGFFSSKTPSSDEGTRLLKEEEQPGAGPA